MSRWFQLVPLRAYLVVGALTLCGSVLFGSAAVAAVRPTSAHVTYTVLELPSLGGTFSIGNAINERGMVSGGSFATGASGISATLWPTTNRIVTLNSLGGPNAIVDIMNDFGSTAGFSETSTLNPLGEDFCQNGTFLNCAAVVWHGKVATALPTLGGYNGSVLFGFNDRGHAVGASEIALQDPTCPAPQVLALEAAVWATGSNTVRMLQPLAGDPDGEAFSINQLDHVVGSTGNCANTFPNGIAASHAVLWRNGRVIDLGTFGGTTDNGAYAINDRDQVVGFSTLTGNAPRHGFLWQNGHMQDLGVLPGDYGSAALWLNNQGQIVGRSCDMNHNCRAVIWERGAMTDLNTLAAAGSTVYMLQGLGINGAGEITGLGVDVNTQNIVAFLAVPSGSMVAPMKVATKMMLSQRARQQLATLQHYTRRPILP